MVYGQQAEVININISTALPVTTSTKKQSMQVRILPWGVTLAPAAVEPALSAWPATIIILAIMKANGMPSAGPFFEPPKLGIRTKYSFPTCENFQIPYIGQYHFRPLIQIVQGFALTGGRALAKNLRKISTLSHRPSPKPDLETLL